MPKVRLNKYIADSDVVSRRAADQLIANGAVSVNNKVIIEMGEKVDPSLDVVMVNGKVIEPITKFIYIMLNKPKGCLTTTSDERGRKTVYDYIDFKERLFPVGRLDYDSEGLLLLTNDGGLTHTLTHPSSEVGKTYLVKVEGEVSESDLALLRKPIMLDNIMTRQSKIVFKEFKNRISKIEITIFEGKNRQIRRMFESIGKNVIFLKRIAIGNLRLGGLSRGTYRFLSSAEVSYLKQFSK